MVGLVFLALLRADALGFRDFRGLYDLGGGQILAVTSTDRASLFNREGDLFYQFRDTYSNDEDARLGAVLVRKSLFTDERRVRIDPRLIPGHPELQVDGSYGEPSGDQYGPKGSFQPEAMFRIDHTVQSSQGVTETFAFHLYNYATRGLITQGTGVKCGEISDVAVSGLYTLGKTMSIQIKPEDSGSNPDPFTGTMVWLDHQYDIDGFRDLTHCYWKARDHETREPKGFGFAEWVPSEKCQPGHGHKWLPADSLFLQCDGAMFGHKRTMYVARVGD